MGRSARAIEPRPAARLIVAQAIVTATSPVKGWISRRQFPYDGTLAWLIFCGSITRGISDHMNDTSTASCAPAPAIALSGVNLSLGRGAARVHILKDITLHIGQGEAVGLVGPSGSGKSTLLMVMAGLERADAGSVVVAGEDIGRLDEDRLARFRGRHVGIVFQSFHLIPTMTALENVAVPLELAGVADAFDRAEKELCAGGLSHPTRQHPAELSRRG